MEFCGVYGFKHLRRCEYVYVVGNRQGNGTSNSSRRASDILVGHRVINLKLLISSGRKRSREMKPLRKISAYLCSVMQRLFQSSRFVQRSTLLAAPSRLPGPFLSLSSCRVHSRFLSTQFPPIAIPNHPISEKLQQRTQAAISQTPEEIWKLKSKKALEDAISSPPADPYAGINARVLHHSIYL